MTLVDQNGRVLVECEHPWESISAILILAPPDGAGAWLMVTCTDCGEKLDSPRDFVSTTYEDYIQAQANLAALQAEQ